MTTGVAIPGGSGPLSIRNLLCGGDVHGNALGRWSMLALPELPACCLVICLSHTATGRFLLRMSGARTDEPGVKRRGLRAGGLIGLAVGGKQGCDRRRHLTICWSAAYRYPGSMCVGFPKVLAAFRPHAGDLVFLGDRRRLEDVRNTMALRWRPGAHQAR